MNEAGTILGLDDEDKKFNVFGYDAMWRPMVFVGLQHDNVRYKGDKYGINGYFGGAKASFYENNQVLEVFGMYEPFNSRATLSENSANSSQKNKIKSHIFNLGTKYAIDFKLKPNLYIWPDLALCYSFMYSPAFNGSNGASHKLCNRYLLVVVTGLSIVLRQDDWLIRGFATYHCRFGTKGKTTATGVSTKADLTKKRFLEYGVEVTKANIIKNANVNFKLSRKTLGIREFNQLYQSV